MIQEQGSARSGNAGEIEHAQNSLTARERELQDALAKRNEAAGILAKAQDRLTQLNKLFETPHREVSTSEPSNLPQVPPPPGLTSSSPTVANEALRTLLEAQRLGEAEAQRAGGGGGAAGGTFFSFHTSAHLLGLP